MANVTLDQALVEYPAATAWWNCSRIMYLTCGDIVVWDRAIWERL